MSDNLELEIFKQFKAAQEKYIYFLLVAAASAIGYAMTQSKVEPLEYWQIPLGLFVFFWAVSFMSGLQFVVYSNSFTFQNHNYLAFKRELKKYPADEAKILLTKFKEIQNTTSEKQQNKMQLYGSIQNYTLLLGAFFYIVWHILRMYKLTA